MVLSPSHHPSTLVEFNKCPCSVWVRRIPVLRRSHAQSSIIVYQSRIHWHQHRRRKIHVKGDENIIVSLPSNPSPSWIWQTACLQTQLLENVQHCVIWNSWKLGGHIAWYHRSFTPVLTIFLSRLPFVFALWIVPWNSNAQTRPPQMFKLRVDQDSVFNLRLRLRDPGSPIYTFVPPSIPYMERIRSGADFQICFPLARTRNFDELCFQCVASTPSTCFYVSYKFLISWHGCMNQYQKFLAASWAPCS